MGAGGRRRGADGEASRDRPMVPDGEGPQRRVGNGERQAQGRRNPPLLPQLRPIAGDGGAPVGDARGGVAGPGAEGEVEGVPLPPLPPDLAAGAATGATAGGGDGDSVSWI